MDAPDIVTQLRNRNERYQAQHGNYLYYAGSDSILDCEAANEIERLRAYAAGLIERLDRCQDETRAIDADLAERRKAQERPAMRQPIETAPKDGSKILLFDPNWSEQFPDGAIGNWYVHPSVSGWVADEIDCNDYEFEPMHWAPLDRPEE